MARSGAFLVAKVIGERVERHRAAPNQPCVKLPDIEFLTQPFAGIIAVAQDRQFADFVCEGLRGKIARVA